jgi:hypothetical protein
MRNTLALVDPSNGEVTRVVAENVEMEINEVPESSDFKSNDELAEEWDQKLGKRAPVVIQGSQSNLIVRFSHSFFFNIYIQKNQFHCLLMPAGGSIN